MTSLGITAASVAALALVAQLSFCGQTVDLASIDSIATTLCKFAPDLDTVNAFINANGSLKTATAIAQEVCKLYLASQGTTTVAGQKLGAAAPGTDVKFVVLYNGKAITVSGKVTQ
jgi:hypothetical protein